MLMDSESKIFGAAIFVCVVVLVFSILISSFTDPDMTCAVGRVLKGSNQSSVMIDSSWSRFCLFTLI